MLPVRLVRILAIAVTCVLGLAAVSPAMAKVWPQPAEGDSRSGNPELIFTFDDGPNTTTTPKILDILKQNKVHAVFFVVGKMVDEPNVTVKRILKRIIAEGHIIANHTWGHKDLCRKQNEELAADQIDRGHDSIVRLTGIEPVWFRTPFGARCEFLEGLLAERDLHHFHWDLDPQEWRHGKLDRTTAYLINSVNNSFGRNVLLMHDIKQVTVKALPIFFAWLTIENEKRRLLGQKQILIVPAPQIAYEQMGPAFLRWTRETVTRIAATRIDLANALP